MGARKGKRLQIELPVSVSGFDMNGDPFVQKAKTVDISWCGIRLKGIRCVRGPGDIVRVQYKDKRGRYRVVWMEKDTATLGLEGVEGARLLFGDHLPPSAGIHDEVDTYSPPPAVQSAASSTHGAERRAGDRRQGERRRYPRYNCAGIASVRESNSHFGSEGRVLDISMCGCYVEMMSPMRVGTPIRLDINFSGHALSLPAIVRMAQLNMGMGVEFTDVPPGEMEKLRQAIAELSGEPQRAAATATSAPAGSAAAIQLGSAVLRWFATHEQLTRKEFQELLRENKQPS
ncbi:MAG: PilZ domain-containing protein [Acidobacteriia bacterium]|nr:PilZ domain-containing protein [Terriglobia bacterium]